MMLLTRSLLPVVEARRRTTRRYRAKSLSGQTRHEAGPGRTLAVIALAIVRRAERPERRPAAWAAPPFPQEVDLVRLHLGPIRSRVALAASFGREAFHADVELDGDAVGPVTAAYALRWLELGDGRRRASWQDWLAAAADRPAPGVPRAATS